MARNVSCLLSPLLLVAALAYPAWSADQPQFGTAWHRNMVSAERNLPAWFDGAAGKNLRWKAELGSETHGTPVISNGRVYIGTNNGQPRDPRHKGDRGVLMCFDERTGAFLWQLVVPKRTEDIYFDWPNSGICSPPTVEGDRLYVVSNRGEVMCLDALGMTNGNDGPFTAEGRHMTPADENPVLQPGPLDADIVWLFDLTSGAGIWSHDGAHSSVIIDGDFLYLNTATGVDNTHRKIRTPDAPSLVVLDKRTGKLLAREREGIAPNIFHCTWSAPSIGTVQGVRQMFFAAGNGILYSFKLPFADNSPDPSATTPAILQKIWQFDFDPEAPKTNVHRFTTNRRESPSNFFGMPVYENGLLYLAGGGDIWWGKNEAWLKCVRPDGTGDITTNGLVWSYPLKKHVMSTPAVAGGLVFIADCGGLFHCVEADTGKPLWTHEILGEAWASAFVADGKVYLGTRRGQLYVFQADRQKQLLATIDLGSPVSATAVAANGTLYITTMKRLYALVEKGDKPETPSP